MLLINKRILEYLRGDLPLKIDNSIKHTIRADIYGLILRKTDIQVDMVAALIHAEASEGPRQP